MSRPPAFLLLAGVALRSSAAASIQRRPASAGDLLAVDTPRTTVARHAFIAPSDGGSSRRDAQQEVAFAADASGVSSKRVPETR